jgi:membrane fusion protein (multidrug efflux system)
MRVDSGARAVGASHCRSKEGASLDQAELNLQYTKVTAPGQRSGQQSHRRSGQNVQPGQEMMKIIPLGEGDIWVTANFKETQLRKMRPGQAADIEVDATGKTYKGMWIPSPAPAARAFSLLPPENATGNYVKVVQRRASQDRARSRRKIEDH